MGRLTEPNHEDHEHRGGSDEHHDDTDDDEYWACAQSVFERYNDAPSDGTDVRPILEFMMNKRVVVRVRPKRTASWDHAKT